MVRAIDAWMLALLDPLNVGKAMDYTETGLAGHSVRPSATMKELREWRIELMKAIQYADDDNPQVEVSKFRNRTAQMIPVSYYPEEYREYWS